MNYDTLSSVLIIATVSVRMNQHERLVRELWWEASVCGSVQGWQNLFEIIALVS